MCAAAMASSQRLDMEPGRLVTVLKQVPLQAPCNAEAQQDAVQVNNAKKVSMLKDRQHASGLPVNKVSSRVHTSYATPEIFMGDLTAGRSLLPQRPLQSRSTSC